MSMYNMLCGMTVATFFVLPMLGKHPEEFPRYRDCFLGDPEHPKYNDYIHVYTRVGSLNQNCDFGEEKLYKDKNFITFIDDKEDRTYGSYVFKVPKKWKADFTRFTEGKLKEFSEEYKKQLYKIYPKLKDEFDILFQNCRSRI